MFGGSGPDYMKSNAGDDRMIAGSGDDTMIGGSGMDTIYAGSHPASRDLIYGGSGDDTIVLGGGTAAMVYAGSGDDRILTGTTGDDTITGGATVHAAHTLNQLAGESYNSAGYLTITFSNDQVLTVKGATIDFLGGGIIHA
jgi:Ca2+-binding RTX toxin-like protein